MTPDNAADILEEILDAQNKSYYLGLKLKVAQCEVEAIHKTYTDPLDRLLHIFIAFLKGVKPKPTWRVIVDALRSRAVNLTALAEKVEEAHCPDTTSTRDIVGRMCYDCNFLGYRRQEYSAGSQEEGVYTLTSHIKNGMAPATGHRNSGVSNGHKPATATCRRHRPVVVASFWL